MPFLTKKKNAIRITGVFCFLLAGAMVHDTSAVVLSDYALFGRDTLIVKERTIVTDGYIGANRYSELGIDAILKGNLRCRNNAQMLDRSKVEGNVTVGGTLTRGSSTIVTGTITEHTTVDSIPIPTKTFSVGTSDFTANSGEVKTITPGSYRDFHAYAQSRVYFNAGTYNFRKLLLEPDVQLNITATQDSVAINVSEQVLLSDRDSILMGGTFDPSKIILYTNQTANITIGTDGKYLLTFLAPYTGLQVGARNNINGRICARKLVVDQDASITKSYTENYLSWAHSQNIIFNTKASGANVSGNVTNFPVLVRLNSTNFRFSEALHSGEDIRFTKADATTGLKYEIERWDSVNQVADIWVNVDTVKGNDSTQYIIMHWGKTGVASQSKSSSVFDTANGFTGVYHMHQAYAGAIDGTKNGLNGTANGGVTYLQPGIVGYSGGFDGNGDYFDMGNNTRFQMDATDKVTVSAWVKRAGAAVAGVEEGIVGKFEWTSGNYREYCLINNRTTNTFQFHISSSGTDASETKITAGVVPTNGIWYYVTGTMDASTMAIFVDGVQKNSAAKSAIYGSTNSTCKIGLMDDNGSTVRQYWNGTIDEVRIERVNRSANWIKLCYENQKLNSTFISFGTSYLKPLVSLVRLVPSINESDSVPVQAIRVNASVASRSSSNTTIPVKLNYGGSATNGVDYEFMSSLVNVTVPADSLAAAVVLSITPIQDLDDEQSDTIIARIVQDTAYYRTCGNDTVKILMLDDDLQVPPSITLEPRDTAVMEGSIVPFTVAASGTQPLLYQWRKNGVAIPGANSPTYITPPVSIADSGSLYDCYVSNGVGNDISRAAFLSVSENPLAPRIIRQPVSLTLCEGDTAKFLIRADGTKPITYQWFSGGDDTLTGMTDTVLPIGPLTMTDNGRTFYCIVSNIAGSVRSRTVVLVVKRPSSQMIVVSGDLFDEQGIPVGYTGTRSMDFLVQLYPSINGDSAVYTESFLAEDNQSVEVSMGKFAIKLGEGKSLNNLMEIVRSNPNLWAEFTVTRPGGNPETLAPRTPLTASPYALSGMPQLLKGTVDPGTVSIDAPIGTHYLNTASTTTFIRTARGWKELD